MKVANYTPSVNRANGQNPPQNPTPPASPEPKDAFYTAAADFYGDVTPLFLGITAASAGARIGEAIGSSLGQVGAVAGTVVGLVGGAVVGNYVGKEATSFYGDLGASLDKNAANRGRFLGQAAFLGLTAGTFGSPLGAVFMLGVGAAVGGWAAHKAGKE
ncbi:MAG: hypothetical protein AB7S38_14170 [Vulcanimicrobiota bacterium]